MNGQRALLVWAVVIALPGLAEVWREEFRERLGV